MGPGVRVELPVISPALRAGQKAQLRFHLVDAVTGADLDDLADVHIVAVRDPGPWNVRGYARSAGHGVYVFELIPPQPGKYRVVLECPSRRLPFNRSPQLVFDVLQEEGR